MVETFLHCGVAWVHEDFDYTNDVVVCFDKNHNLLVIHSKRYDHSPEDDSTIVATVSADDAFIMAKSMKVSLKDLTYEIASKVRAGECWNNSEITEAFSQALNLILAHGAHYTIQRYNADESHRLWDRDPYKF